jgi:8-amino-7-oxononanoate synthase
MNLIEKTKFLENELAQIDEKGLMRDLRPFLSNGGKFVHNSNEILNLSSNDYLNLSRDPFVKKGSSEALEKYGCGATASRLVSGHLNIHEELENSLAELCGNEACLVFGSGFLANIGVLNVLSGRNDEVYADKLNHASLIDGVLLSGAKCFRYRHKDMAHLEMFLKKSKTVGLKIIVSDSIFSMDGDIAPIKDLMSLAKKYGALLIIDEAHAIGVFGRGGGICKELGAEFQPDVILGTLSKAFGGYGGFVVCSSIMRKYLINKARSFIYSTGLPPACIGSAIAAIQIINNKKNMGKILLKRAKEFYLYLTEAGFKMQKFESQILPLHVGDNLKAVEFSKELFDKYKILAVAIRPPTVPVGTARLRLSVSLAHSESDLKIAAEKIKECAKGLGLLSESYGNQ